MLEGYNLRQKRKMPFERIDHISMRERVSKGKRTGKHSYMLHGMFGDGSKGVRILSEAMATTLGNEGIPIKDMGIMSSSKKKKAIVHRKKPAAKKPAVKKAAAKKALKKKL